MPDPSKDVHKKSLGRAGERRAAKYLKKLGYKLLAKNYKTPFGEADIVAKDGETIVFCEVKTRLSEAFGTPAEAVEYHKRERYKKIARYYESLAGEELFIRFDVVEVLADRVRHIENAFGA